MNVWKILEVELEQRNGMEETKDLERTVLCSTSLLFKRTASAKLKNMRETVFFFEDECFCTEMRVLERGVEIVG